MRHMVVCAPCETAEGEWLGHDRPTETGEVHSPAHRGIAWPELHVDRSRDGAGSSIGRLRVQRA